jgi:DNA helicase-2/ATP-dependent DNA helicase PcrA
MRTPEPRRWDLEQLEHIAGHYRSRRRFLTGLTLDPPTSTADFAGPPTLDDDCLSTNHSAKGCVRDVVYLIHATDGILPSDQQAIAKDIRKSVRAMWE